MKLKVYNIAAMACLCLIALGNPAFSQQSSSNSSSSTTTAPSRATAPRATARSLYSTDSLGSLNLAQGYTAYSVPAQTYNSFNYTPLASVNGVYFLDNFSGSQDSTYLKKMKKLQEQMSAVQKEMSELRTEESKRRVAEMQKRNAERQAEMQKRYADAFASSDKKFGTLFSAVGTRYSSDRNQADLDKKVASGDAKMKTKTVSKSFAVDANDKLSIVNKFGKVTVNVWNKNEIKVEVDIKAYADDDDKATELLNEISVDGNKTGDGVSFTTKIDEDHKNTWIGTMTSNGKTSVRNAIINYTVYMPAKNSLNIANMHGSVVLPDLMGRVILKNQFGNFAAKSLSNPGNDIDLRYTDANIESLTGGDLKMQFGTLSLQAADKLNADLQYTPAKFGKLTNSAIINARFGEGVQINNLDKNLKTLSITSQYAPVKLISPGDANFFVTTSYGDFIYDNDKVKVTSKTPSDDNRNYSLTKTYKGEVGKGDNDKTITIKSTFSSVKFDQ